jgi:hypothetical protein
LTEKDEGEEHESVSNSQFLVLLFLSSNLVVSADFKWKIKNQKEETKYTFKLDYY